MSQPCAFVDPSSLSLPSTSLSRLPSPACSTDDSTPCLSAEPPRKRPRSAVTPEERKEARAHRNRIAAQNSRDRRKAQFTYLERRVAELEDENRRLRAGIVTPSSSTPIPLPDTSPTQQEQEQRHQAEEQRERENQELRERIRTLEKGYEAVVRALAAQGNLSVTSGIPTPPVSTSTTAHSQPQSVSNLESSEALSSSPPDPISSTLLPLSPTSSNSTLADSPLIFTSGDSFDFAKSPAFPASDTSLAVSPESLDLSLTNNTSTRHLARVANTADRSAVSLQRVGGAQIVMGPFEDEAASDAAITRLFAEILASPPLGSSALPSSGTSSEDAFSKETLNKTEANSTKCDLGRSGIDTVDWAEQVHAEMEMEKLLEMLPNAQDVSVDAILNPSVSLDVDMDFSSTLTWDGVSVF